MWCEIYTFLFTSLRNTFKHFDRIESTITTMVFECVSVFNSEVQIVSAKGLALVFSAVFNPQTAGNA